MDLSERTFWRWIFGLALAPTAGWGWLSRELYPDSRLLGLTLSLIPTYLVSALFTGLLVGIALAVYDGVLEAWDFLRELLGFHPTPWS